MNIFAKKVLQCPDDYVLMYFCFVIFVHLRGGGGGGGGFRPFTLEKMISS